SGAPARGGRTRQPALHLPRRREARTTPDSRPAPGRLMAARKKTPIPSAAQVKAQQSYATEARLENEKLSSYLSTQLANSFKKNLGIATVGELLEYYPRKYLPRGELSSFTQLV